MGKKDTVPRRSLPASPELAGRQGCRRTPSPRCTGMTARCSTVTADITPTRSLLMALHSPVEMTKSARKAGRPSIKTAWRSAASGWKSAIPGATAGWRTLIPRRLSSGSKPSLMTTSNCSPQSCLTAGTKARSPASGIALRPLSPSG